MEVLVAVVGGKKRTISIPQARQETPITAFCIIIMRCFVPVQTSTSVPPSQENQLLCVNVTQINHPQIGVTAYGRWIESLFPMKNQGMQKSAERRFVHLKMFCRELCFPLLCNTATDALSAQCPWFSALYFVAHKKRRGQKFAPKYQRLRKSKRHFTCRCKKFSYFTIGFEKYGNGNFGPWIKEIVNGKHFEFVNISKISPDCLRYSYCLCNICVPTERKFSGTSNKNVHKTRK